MSPKKERRAKSETLSLRLDPKTKFSLEFVARINGQTLTTFVERAIRASCDQVTIGRGDFGSGFNWQDFWDPEEGVRTLKLLACKDYPSTYDEDDLRKFISAHRVFFYERSTPRHGIVEVLWPKIDQYRQIWREQREMDYWAAGLAMAADLQNARLKAPDWPPIKKPEPEQSSPVSSSRDMDDEIPF